MNNIPNSGFVVYTAERHVSFTVVIDCIVIVQRQFQTLFYQKKCNNEKRTEINESFHTV